MRDDFDIPLAIVCALAVIVFAALILALLSYLWL